MSAGRSINTLSQSWGTPPKYVKAVKDFFGGTIDLDPCSNEYSIVHARVEYSLPYSDGLNETWNYPTIYVNPPYGIDKERGTTIKNWLAKCAEAHEKFGSEVLALVPIAANTTHWKKYIFTQATAICFLYDTRLRFLENGRDVGKGAPMACAMIYWGNRFPLFFDIFIEYGAVVDISNLIGVNIGKERQMPNLFITRQPVRRKSVNAQLNAQLLQ
ncbi:MAG: phage N-6-adenine-methyltransferase [Prevotellaceae bacterium]|jgi:hypothetical protein|nr:phage N-6-adenine-methyltransferase [Prevotellaceae bacterium]